MKLKKLLIMIIIILFIIFTYYIYKDDKINYVSLGDSVAAGQNPYGEIGLGYTDYIKEYLESKDKLKSYSDYAVSGYKTSNIIEDINNNKSIPTNGSNTNIRKDLRESDLVTISIGANDFMSGLTLTNIDPTNIDNYLKKIDNVMIEIEKTFKIIREYAKNEVVVIGYYNPFPILFNKNEKEVDMVFNYADTAFKRLADKYDIEYMSIYVLFKENSKFLPNPFDIHPNIEGYKAISELFIKNYLK